MRTHNPINPIVEARKKATVEQYKKFVIKPDAFGHAHYNAMIQEDAKYWKAQAWFVQHAIKTLNMTIEDFTPPIEENVYTDN